MHKYNLKAKFWLFIKYYLPALIWAGIIFYFSSLPGLRYFPETAKEIFFRKGAHFVEFSILAILLWRIFYSALKLEVKKTYFLVFILAALYGASDEWHQTFIFGRTGKIIDAVFDGVSIVYFLELILIYVRKKISWKNILILVLGTLTLIGLELKMIEDGKKMPKNITVETQNNPERKQKEAGNKKIQNNTELKQNSAEKKVSPGKEIPDEILIKVPFTVQAPFAKWDELHEEACEEAAGIMLAYYLLDKKLTPTIAEQEIQDLIKFENKKLGDYKDTTAEQTANIIAEFYQLDKTEKKLNVIYDFSQNDLKKYLAHGYPIIVPAAGRELGNSNFTPPGPLYHNLVLVGYDDDTIITNDPGTKRGEGYEYNIDVLYKAIHDFPGQVKNIEKGRKAMIVVE